MAEVAPVSSPVSKGWLEDSLVKKWDSKRRWHIRLVLVAIQLILLIITTLVQKSSGPTQVTMVVLAFAFPPMLNALLQGLATRGIRVVAVLGVLILLLLHVAGIDSTVLPTPYPYEWVLGIVTPLVGIALIFVPEPTAGTDLFGFINGKGKKWKWPVFGITLVILTLVIWWIVVNPLITS